MGQIIENLSSENVFMDSGTVSILELEKIEHKYGIILPESYIKFIIKHNNAYLYANNFNYYDPNTKRNSADSIAFDDVRKIIKNVDLLKSDQFEDEECYFDSGLIPIGENGGGDIICLDYRNNKKCDPSVVLWNHDMGLHHRTVFIAENFDSFAKMLFRPKD